jgi:crotonobetainyl-CoA:carnitine CoA-transferase CaiB-like acyl-CoA transferase
VIELGERVAAPAAGRLLAGFGADVVKVEAPDGDPTRRWGPFRDDESNSEASGTFLYLNTGKRSVTANLSSEGGREVFQRLVSGADLLITNYSRVQMSEPGLSYAALSAGNPKLGMVSITDFGLDGPYADFQAVALTQFAMGGQMWMTGEPYREPIKNFGYQAEQQAGAQAFAASLALIVGAVISGSGDHIDLSIQEVQASILEVNGPNAFNYGTESYRHGNVLRATWGIYPCRDGYVGIHILDRNLPEFFHVLSRDDLTQTYLNPMKRAEDNDLLEALVYAWCADRTEKEIFEAGVDAGAPIAYLPRVAELLAWQALAEKGFWHLVDHPVAGALPYPGAPLTIDGSPYKVSCAPMLGEHTDLVLGEELGYRPEEIAALRALGAV